MADKQDKRKLANVVLESLELEKQLAEVLTKLSENEKVLIEHFQQQGTKKLEVQSSKLRNVVVEAKLCERCTVKYDAQKLKKKLDTEIFNEVTKRSYTINNINAMIDLLKKAGISPKDFKQLIDVKVTVDGAAIKRLYDSGDIEMKDLRGCYEAKFSKSVKVTERQQTADNS